MRSLSHRLVARLGARAGMLDLVRPGPADAADEGSRGFHESSFDLRHGLEVLETEAATLPDEYRSEWARQAGQGPRARHGAGSR